MCGVRYSLSVFFFFNDTATTEIYTLSLHDALPIWIASPGTGGQADWTERRTIKGRPGCDNRDAGRGFTGRPRLPGDRKSTRLNSSHANISYAVFCLKKKKQTIKHRKITDTIV